MKLQVQILSRHLLGSRLMVWHRSLKAEKWRFESSLPSFYSNAFIEQQISSPVAQLERGDHLKNGRLWVQIPPGLLKLAPVAELVYAANLKFVF